MLRSNPSEPLGLAARRYVLPTNRANFSILKELGSGAFGTVYHAIHKNTRTNVALKIIKLEDVSKEILEREIAVQAQLKHPNILGLDGYFEEKQRLFIVLHYESKGDLRSYIYKKAKLSEVEAAGFSAQICEGLIYCHSKNVIHRDIKPENLLLSSENTLKLSDFGSSVQSQKPRSTLCGTPLYLSPELLNDNRCYDRGVDIWALGVVIYEMAEGTTPFEDLQNPIRAMDKIISCRYKVPKSFTISLASLIRALLVSDPKRRLPLKDVLQHPWIEKNKEILPQKDKKPTERVVLLRAFFTEKFGDKDFSTLCDLIDTSPDCFISVTTVRKLIRENSGFSCSLEVAFDLIRRLSHA